MSFARWAIGWAFLISFALAGCDKPGPTLAPVSGTVTLDDTPLSEGTIYFKTVSTGAVESMPVKDGRFEGKAEPGERRVEITAYKSHIAGTGEMKGEVKESLIASRFNINSELKATVTKAGPNTFTFEVKGK